MKKIQETEVRLKYNEINKAEKTVLEMVFLNMEKVIKELEFGNSDIISYEIYISLISRRRDEGYRELMCSEILNNIILEYIKTLNCEEIKYENRKL